MGNAIILISCRDQKGITAAVTNFIFQNDGNIIHADQHIDEQSNTFFMRVEWALEGFAVGTEEITAAFTPIAAQYEMSWDLYFSEQKQRLALFVSKHLHCLYDILYRHRSGHWSCDIPLIISNHPDGKYIADDFGISYHELPITPENKIEQEKRQLMLLEEFAIDTVALARYHQIFTPQFISAYPNRIINIHHSFLPAFAGGKPYAQAFRKGVKIIGATSHYVTEALDEGPIIEQDTVRISHRDNLDDLVRRGEDLEKAVFSRAIRWHIERKILCYGNKTVVFN